MKTEGLLSARGLVSAFVLAVAGLALAWVCVRTSIVGVLPPNAPAVRTVAPHSPNAVLRRAAAAFIQRNGRFDAETLDAVRRAATGAPLDARPFLILGSQQLAERKTARAVQSLEAGQRLDPRNRIIHLLLLENYLRTNRFTDAAAQFSVLARLVGPAQPTIATAMAQMMLDPDMHDAARQTLRRDPMLERGVLTALAKSTTEPQDIFAFASPTALADAGRKESWGPVLVSRLVEAGRFGTARAVWQRIYRLSDSVVATPIFNPAFRPTPASAPFNWTLTAGGLGAADPQRGALAIDYYGRDSGDLARQLLVLAPGRYQLAFATDGGKPGAASRLFWTVACVGEDKTVPANIAVPTGPGTHRTAAAFAISAGCPAQTLTLRGEAGEFPSAIALTIEGVTIRPLTERRP